MTDMTSRLSHALASRYTIERELGSGGMATVYLAEDVKHNRKVAVKVLRPDLAAVLGIARFLKEIEVTANLNHPHILPLYDSGETDGFLYYVMPYVEGESLRDRLNREQQLPVDDALKIASEVADALISAHKQGVIHRDIKPENILLREGHAVVADFGIALAVKSAGGDRITETGLSLGTPAYMSPEQVAGDRNIDGRSDIYSLACVLYEMLAGEPPFTGPNPQAVLARQVAATVPSITTLRSAVSAPVAAAITKALGKAPADRYVSASAFVEALYATEVEPEQKSIAVLPFANMSADPDNEYFSDGITEEIINALTKLRDLRVAARTSAFVFKGKSADIKEVGKTLQVATVLEGSVRKAGNRLRITAQLINVSDGYHLWSERYDRELTDVFEIQDEIAAAVVEQLKVSLLGAPEAGARAGHTDDIEAYELYLRGRHFWNQRPSGLKKALEYFQLAVERDPNYALAHAGLADGFAMIGLWNGTKRLDAYPIARAAARRAIELDPDLAQPHAILGFIALYHDWDWEATERELLRAMELNPRYVESYLFYAQYLGNIKHDHEAAIRCLRQAHELEPLLVMVMAHLSFQLVAVNHLEEALAAAEKALELAPNFSNGHLAKGEALRMMSRYDDAIAALKRGIDLTGGQLLLVGELGVTYANAGRFEEARAICDDRELGDAWPSVAALVSAAMGQADAAFEWLERAYEQRDPFVTLFRWWARPSFDQDDPRCKELERKLALP